MRESSRPRRAGVLVAARPAIGSYVVAAWLVGIVVSLVSIGDHYDVALRDFGLLAGALALAMLAAPGPRTPGVSRSDASGPRQSS
jgi:hypothetical protein